MSIAGKLFIVPTPIGNLSDITYRAVDVLKTVDLILAEDTRTSSVLLRHYHIDTPVKSFHAHNEHRKAQDFTALLEDGTSIAQISDAGTPGISDPGFLLVREALAAGIEVECLPGPTAFIPALVKSGIPCDRFLFEGFLPHKKGRQTRIEALSEEKRTVVLYESPHRLMKTLEQFMELSPDRKVSVSRELTKKFEETVNATLEEAVNYFREQKIRGEFVVILEGVK